MDAWEVNECMDGNRVRSQKLKDEVMAAQTGLRAKGDSVRRWNLRVMRVSQVYTCPGIPMQRARHCNGPGGQHTPAASKGLRAESEEERGAREGREGSGRACEPWSLSQARGEEPAALQAEQRLLHVPLPPLLGGTPAQ